MRGATSILAGLAIASSLSCSTPLKRSLAAGTIGAAAGGALSIGCTPDGAMCGGFMRAMYPLLGLGIFFAGETLFENYLRLPHEETTSGDEVPVEDWGSSGDSSGGYSPDDSDDTSGSIYVGYDDDVSTPTTCMAQVQNPGKALVDEPELVAGENQARLTATGTSLRTQSGGGTTLACLLAKEAAFQNLGSCPYIDADGGGLKSEGFSYVNFFVVYRKDCDCTVCSDGEVTCNVEVEALCSSHQKIELKFGVGIDDYGDEAAAQVNSELFDAQQWCSGEMSSEIMGCEHYANHVGTDPVDSVACAVALKCRHP